MKFVVVLHMSLLFPRSVRALHISLPKVDTLDNSETTVGFLRHKGSSRPTGFYKGLFYRPTNDSKQLHMHYFHRATNKTNTSQSHLTLPVYW